MSRFDHDDSFYVKQPLISGDNRDENLLVEVLGNWIPECDIVFYGLLQSDYERFFHKLRTRTKFDPMDTYREMCYFTSKDLLKYLYSIDDNYEDIIIDANLTKEALDFAYRNFFYAPCNETMIRHAIIELAYSNFIKSVTLVYPWEPRDVDIAYLHNIIPEAVIHKFNVADGTLLDVIETTNKESNLINGKYTTIILNSIDDVNELIDNAEKYKTDTAFFLLRNHSENVKLTRIEDRQEFVEVGNEIIIPKLMDIHTGIPKSQMRFARYEPILFEDDKDILPEDRILAF